MSDARIPLELERLTAGDLAIVVDRAQKEADATVHEYWKAAWLALAQAAFICLVCEEHTR